MPLNWVNFDNLHFNSFYNERFSDTEAERDPDENFFNEVNSWNFECSYLFPNEIESLLSEKENSETILKIYILTPFITKAFLALKLRETQMQI